jgi:NAD(P)-dependent dehydrogenase (short-subunit alcohol dehydrogenase family)
MASALDAFRYDGLWVVMVGGAKGMGAAGAALAVDAGAGVTVIDLVRVDNSEMEAIRLDLSDRSSIDGALGALGAPIDMLFSFAGVADGTQGIERINFVAHRYLIDCSVEREWLPPGRAIGTVASDAGLGLAGRHS